MLIPPFVLNSVVSILVGEPIEKRRCLGSGFLYGSHVEDTRYRVFLITCRHVLEGQKQVYLRFNPQEKGVPARDYPLNLEKGGQQMWISHPNNEIDVTVANVNLSILRQHSMQVHYFQSDKHVANIDKLNELGISEGDFIYVLGFPMNIIGAQRNFAIARSGIIARIRDVLSGNSKEYLIDSLIFPGNSGGPVITKPELVRLEGTKSNPRSCLIGMVKSYIPYRDIAISRQTGRPRVIFEDNSGLASVHPVDVIQETITEYERVHPLAEKS